MDEVLVDQALEDLLDGLEDHAALGGELLDVLFVFFFFFCTVEKRKRSRLLRKKGREKTSE